MSVIIDMKSLHRRVDERLEGVSGRHVLAMRQLCREKGLTAQLQREMRESYDGVARAIAARTLLRIREPVSQQAVLDLLDSGDADAVLIAAEAATLFREAGLFLPVFRALREKTAATVDEITRLLRLFGEDVCPTAHGLLKDVLRQHIDAEQPESALPFDPETQIGRNDTVAQKVVVTLLASHGYRVAVPTFSRLLAVCADDGLRLCLVRALASAGEAADSPVGSSMRAA